MSSEPLRFGVLGVAKIATTKVMPPVGQSPAIRLAAIASRDPARARAAAEAHGIPQAHGSYEALLADPAIEAVYIPLPNHLHVEWTLKAAAAGKHVLCEKPIALSGAELGEIARAAERHGVRIMEGFMVFSHPLWQKARDLVREGRIGPVHGFHMNFSSPNYDPANIRNRPEVRGGSLTDKGCYNLALARYLFDAEPERVIAAMELDPEMRIDRLTTGLLSFAAGQASFNCGQQMSACQSLVVIGAKGRIEVDVAVNLPDDVPTRLRLVTGGTLPEQVSEEIAFPPCNQYRLMFEAFARTVRTGAEPPVPLAFSEGNARTIDALFRSADSGRWESL